MNRNVLNTIGSLAVIAAMATTGFAAEKAAQHASTYRVPAMHQAQAQKSAEHKQPVTLAIAGAEDARSADLLTSALREHGLQAKIEPKQGQPSELTTSIPRSMDLSAAGKAVMSTNTVQKASFPPSFDFVLFAPLTKQSAKQAIERLRNLKGVDARNSRANVTKGELWVRINGAARVTPDDVYNTIHAAGIDCHFTKESGRPS